MRIFFLKYNVDSSCELRITLCQFSFILFKANPTHEDTCLEKIVNHIPSCLMDYKRKQ